MSDHRITGTPSMDSRPPIQIAPEQLTPETLRAVIEEFVSRDGTECTDLEIKVNEVRALLSRGEVELWFDPVTGTCNVLVADG